MPVRQPHRTRRVHLLPHEMVPPQRQEALHREGRLELAVQAYKNGDFQSYRAAAQAYDVPRDTLQRRIASTQPRLGSTAKNRLLTPTEEEYLVQRILSMDKRGIPPTAATVRTMASLLASQHGQLVSAGQCWVRNFINCYDVLKLKNNRKYDYQRAKYEDLYLIRAWFKRVQRI